MSGFSADALARRRTKIISGTVYVVGALGSAFSQDATQLIIARFVLGIAVGAASFVSPMYISELAPKRIRGGVTCSISSWPCSGSSAPTPSTGR